MFFFFKDTATTEIYTYRHTLSLDDALPCCPVRRVRGLRGPRHDAATIRARAPGARGLARQGARRGPGEPGAAEPLRLLAVGRQAARRQDVGREIGRAHV